VNTFKDWLLKNLNEQLKDIATNGCQAGYYGLIYYEETSLLYDTYKDEIWEMLYNDSEESGSDNIISFISSFNSANNVTDEKTFKNLLVWYAAEKIASEVTNCDEDEKDA
jgi:hypothetical protein